MARFCHHLLTLQRRNRISYLLQCSLWPLPVRQWPFLNDLHASCKSFMSDEWQVRPSQFVKFEGGIPSGKFPTYSLFLPWSAGILLPLRTTLLAPKLSVNQITELPRICVKDARAYMIAYTSLWVELAAASSTFQLLWLIVGYSIVGYMEWDDLRVSRGVNVSFKKTSRSKF